MRRIFFLLVFIFSGVLVSLAVEFQSDSISKAEEEQYFQNRDPKYRAFSDAKWNEARNGLSYKSKEEKAPPKKEDLDLSFLDFLSQINWTALKYVLIGFVIVIIVALLVFNFRTSLFSWVFPKRVPDFSQVETKDTEITDSELDELKKLLNEALEKREYDEAIRFVYLISLQQLLTYNHIVLKRDLPNSALLSQIKSQELRSKTRQIFSYYEQVWFGKRKVNELDYSHLDQKFSDFMQYLISHKI